MVKVYGVVYDDRYKRMNDWATKVVECVIILKICSPKCVVSKQETGQSEYTLFRKGKLLNVVISHIFWGLWAYLAFVIMLGHIQHTSPRRGKINRDRLLLHLIPYSAMADVGMYASSPLLQPPHQNYDLLPYQPMPEKARV
jgi:hypothetical protein